MAAVTNTRKV